MWRGIGFEVCVYSRAIEVWIESIRWRMRRKVLGIYTHTFLLESRLPR